MRGLAILKPNSANIAGHRISLSRGFKQRQQFRAMLGPIARTALGRHRFQTYVLSTAYVQK
jgi:hypothetical protein